MVLCRILPNLKPLIAEDGLGLIQAKRRKLKKESLLP